MGAKPKSRRVFVVVVVLLLLAGAAFITRAVLQSGKASRHRNASTSLKSLTSAEADFRANDRDWNRVNDYWVGDVSRLYYLEVEKVQIRLIEQSLAQADGAPKGAVVDPGPKCGYLYAAIPMDETGAPYDQGAGRNSSRFAFCAYPEEYRTKAWYRDDLDITTWTFIVDENNTIWKKDTGAKPVTQWPKNLYGEGWSKLD